MRTIYLHGFASAFDVENEKVQFLMSQSVVSPFSYNCCDGFYTNLERMVEFINKYKIDVVVGCSLGGFYALELAKRIPNVFALALNPAYNPHETLVKYVGENVNYKTGETETLSLDIVESYPQMGVATPKNAVVFVETGDEVIEPELSIEYFEQESSETKVVMCDGGSHRFESLPKRWETFERIRNKHHIEQM